MRILIVEDDYINREFLKEMLRRWGDCHVVESGEDAVAAFSSALTGEPYSIVFMDIMLPGMDGLQALEQIRQAESSAGIGPEREVKAIITSALDDDEKATRAFIHGQAISYLNKPISPEMVEEELRQFHLI